MSLCQQVKEGCQLPFSLAVLHLTLCKRICGMQYRVFCTRQLGRLSTEKESIDSLTPQGSVLHMQALRLLNIDSE